MGSKLGALLVLAWSALIGEPAMAADLAPLGIEPAPYVWKPLTEIRAGVFAHNPIDDEHAPVDLTIVGLSSPLALPGYASEWVSGNRWASWFFQPRLDLGGMVNSGGRTSYVFGGFVWRIPIVGRLFFEGELGGAANNAVRSPSWSRIDLGCALTFRESGGFGYQIDERWDVVASVEHISHATFCNKTNPGLTNIGFRIGYRF